MKNINPKLLLRPYRIMTRYKDKKKIWVKSELFNNFLKGNIKKYDDIMNLLKILKIVEEVKVYYKTNLKYKTYRNCKGYRLLEVRK